MRSVVPVRAQTCTVTLLLARSDWIETSRSEADAEHVRHNLQWTDVAFGINRDRQMQDVGLSEHLSQLHHSPARV